MDEEVLKELNFSVKDYEKVVELIGREPSITELGLFSAMWSEHCSYRSSKMYLKELPSSGELLVQGPGENAGIIKITDEIYLAFKVESHNHPSAVEPFQGAATGVGGIIRDIFTMGARPIATLDSLCFGDLNSKRTKYLLNGVVEGISFYGNCVGVPNAGGETHFDPSYSENPLVNVMCVGILKKENLRKSIAKTSKAKVIYIGAKTGRDGLHGASFASGILDDKAVKRRGSVQVGDPFLEKLLIEATLEIIEEDLIEAIQDMGAAGLTSSSVEMAGKGDKGIKLFLDKVPLRETNMTPFEIMLSESQERMLLIAKIGAEKRIKEILDKWELDYAEIGEITDSNCIEIYFGGEMVCNLPIKHLLNPPLNCTPPKMDRKKSIYVREKTFDLSSLLLEPSFGSKRWIYEQYDTTLLSNTVIPPGNGATLLRIKGTDKFIGLTLNSNGGLCAVNPFLGAQTIVAISSRRISALGVKPAAVTDCLNFGNPNNSQTMWEFSECIKGLASALRELSIPVVSGNVSFYNEGKNKRINPTPTIGMVGVGSLSYIPSNQFVKVGDLILIIGGETRREYFDSEALPELNLGLEKNTQELVRELISKGLLKSVQSIDRGGIYLALIRNISLSGIGARICAFPPNFMPSEFLLSESNSRFLVSIDRDKFDLVEKMVGKEMVKVIGETIANYLTIADSFKVEISEIKNNYERSFRKFLEDA
jgi:phosphoribosylformylglycinamidine synthase